MFLPFIYLFLLFLTETAFSLKIDKHPPQPVGSQPDFKMSLKKAEPKLRTEFRQLRKTQFGKGRAGEPNCPNNVLCDYTRGKEGMSKILTTCGDVILIAPFGTIKDNPTFIKFLAIPKEHVASAWSITDMKFIPNAHQCVKKYLSSPGSTAQLQKSVLDACKGDKECTEQHKKLSAAVTGPLRFDDFVTYFHVPPGINHLHMHVALSAKKFRAYSDSHEDDRCMAADAVQEELKKAGPHHGGGAESKVPLLGKMAAGLGLKKSGGMPKGPGKMAPAVARRWNEYKRMVLERRWEPEWLVDPSGFEARSAELYEYT